MGGRTRVSLVDCRPGLDSVLVSCTPLLAVYQVACAHRKDTDRQAQARGGQINRQPRKQT